VALAVPLAAPVTGQSGGDLVLRYRLIELPAEGGGQSRAYSVNSTGQVVGWMESNTTRHAAFWHNRVGTDLSGGVDSELLHPYPLFDQDYAEAYHISDAGQIVGTARTMVKYNGKDIVITNAFVVRPAVLTDLATPYPGDALTNLGTLGDPTKTVAFDSAAISVSNRGHVVGWADLPSRAMHAFLVVPENGQFYADPADPNDPADGVNDLMQDLGALTTTADPTSSATAVNDSGQVTGYAYTVTSEGLSAYRAFLINPVDADADGVVDTWYTGASGVNNLMLDAGTLGGLNSWGRDINNAGEIVGEADYDHPSGAHYTHGFYYKDGPMADLGTLQKDPATGFSAASAINNQGVIVGWAENDNSDRRAFVYSNGTMQDLNDLLYLVDSEGFAVVATIDLTEARDVNDDGVIVGWGTIHGTNGTQTRGFLLNPVFVTQAQLAALDPNNPDGTSVPAAPTPATLGTTYSSQFTYGAPTADTSADTNQPADANNTTTTVAPLTFCAPTSLLFVPLTLAGLIWMSARQRRHTQHR
jgi:probable HAF family extracellular repeat protein